jgi:hypothetical protein
MEHTAYFNEFRSYIESIKPLLGICPFCGCDNIRAHDYTSGMGYDKSWEFVIGCTNTRECGVKFEASLMEGGMSNKSYEELLKDNLAIVQKTVEKWNRRFPPNILMRKM